jgi:hypothetical protein
MVNRVASHDYTPGAAEKPPVAIHPSRVDCLPSPLAACS